MMTFEQKIEAAKLLEALGRSDRQIIAALSSVETSGVKATAASEPQVQETTARDLEMFIKGMEIGAMTTAYDIAKELRGEVPESLGAKRAWTNLVMSSPGLEAVLIHNGCARREKTPWGQSYVFKRVPVSLGNGR